jgi:hypothetical protein
MRKAFAIRQLRRPNGAARDNVSRQLNGAQNRLRTSIGRISDRDGITERYQ